MTKELPFLSTVFILTNLTASPLAFGATQEECDWYAGDAVMQYKRAQSLNISNLSYPVWSTNYQHHFNWCVKTPLSEVNKGHDLRENVIKNHCLKQFGAYGQPTGPRGDRSLPNACLTGIRMLNPDFSSTMKAKPMQQPMSAPKQPPHWTR